MKNNPDFIDNLDGNSMANALKEVLENLSSKPVSNLDIETFFFKYSNSSFFFLIILDKISI